MTLLQLQYLVAIVDSQLSISAAAEKLETTQPVVSKQIQSLEQELGFAVFQRTGKRLSQLSAEGEQVATIARRMLSEANNIDNISADFKNAIGGELRIATTHTQARYVLPPVISAFLRRFKDCRLILKQGNPQQCAAWVASGEADLAIATEALAQNAMLATLPCYEWNRVIIAPKGHSIGRLPKPTLKDLAAYPIITYDASFTGRSAVDSAFSSAGLKPNFSLSALDSDVIKTYVRLGLGVGIIAEMAVDPKLESDFVVIPAGHLFRPSVTRLGLRRGAVLRLTVYEFLGHFMPKLTKRQIQAALKTSSA